MLNINRYTFFYIYSYDLNLFGIKVPLAAEMVRSTVQVQPTWSCFYVGTWDKNKKQCLTDADDWWVPEFHKWCLFKYL
jgi:hypothetical protein